MTITPLLTTLVIVVPLMAASLLTRQMRLYAMRKGQLDRPNARSSHVQPTPRGGGISFVVTTLVATIVIALLDAMPAALALGMVVGGALVAGVGFLDDRRGVAARWRFLTHFAAIAWLLWVLDGWNGQLLGNSSDTLRALLFGVALIGGVWLINLTNFMDGIDGTQALTACAGIAACSMLRTETASSALLPLALAAGVMGFLRWNWPPARIFMGDAGSGFLGFCFATLAIDAAITDPPLFWCCLILLGVFITDATVTILRRQLRGERVTEAHRTHGYQHAARRWGGHRPVTLTVAIVNVAWLLPCAVLTAMDVLRGPMALAVAYAPLLVLALWAKSGAPERPRSDTAPIRHTS